MARSTPARRVIAPAKTREERRRFAQDTIAELKKVIWPTRPEIVNLTFIVIVVSVVVGVILGGIDYIFAQVMELLIR